MEKIAIITGGYTKEKEISLLTAENVYYNINKKKYIPYIVYIYNNNKWFIIHKNKKILIKKRDFSIILNNKHIKFDIVFNSIHGTPGEDGIIQKYLTDIRLPYTHSSIIPSSITYDKKICNKILNSINVITPKIYNINNIQFPCFIKKRKSGSSIDIYKIYNNKELINNKKLLNNMYIIEEYIKGIEVSISIIKNRYNKFIIFPITEIIYNNKNNFFDYSNKYNITNNFKEITPPINISNTIQNNIIKITKKIYNILYLSGISRFDYIISNKNKIPYLLDINTVPGLTKNSIIIKQIKKCNISLKNIIDELLYIAKLRNL